MRRSSRLSVLRVINDAHLATVSWGDGTTTAAIVAESGGTGIISASHPYLAPAVHTLTVSVNDGNLSGSRTSSSDVPAYIVVFDPAAGFVTGGGWFESPAGQTAQPSSRSRRVA